MAKRSTEHPKLLFYVDFVDGCGKVLRPAMPFVEEQMMHYAVGANVEIQLWQDRSPEHHALYWCVLAECVANSENKYGSSQDLHSAIKVALGYTHKVKLLGVGPAALAADRLAKWATRIVAFVANALPFIPEKWRKAASDLSAEAGPLIEEVYKHTGDTLVLPGSISFHNMDQAEFRIFFDAAMNELRKAGYPIDEILAVAKQKVARHNQARRRPYRKPQPGDHHGRSETAPRGDRGSQTDAEAKVAA